MERIEDLLAVIFSVAVLSSVSFMTFAASIIIDIFFKYFFISLTLTSYFAFLTASMYFMFKRKDKWRFFPVVVAFFMFSLAMNIYITSPNLF